MRLRQVCEQDGTCEASAVDRIDGVLPFCLHGRGPSLGVSRQSLDTLVSFSSIARGESSNVISGCRRGPAEAIDAQRRHRPGRSAAVTRHLRVVVWSPAVGVWR